MGVDWDNILQYPTVKIVNVKDRYLGAIRYLALLGIIGYILGYIIVWDKGYNKCVVPDGGIQLAFLDPNQEKMIYPSNYTYCEQYNESNQNISDPLHCVVVDPIDVYEPVDQTAAMMITTRFSQILQYQNPNCSVGCKSAWIKMNSSNYTGDNYYALGVDYFQVRLRHFFQARAYYLETHDSWYSQSCKQMSGDLINSKTGNTMQHYGKDKTDIISLKEILKAARVDLGDVTDMPADQTQNQSNRFAGLILLFYIDYNGIYGSTNVQYKYTVTKVPKVEYNIITKTMIGVDERLVTNRHGIKIFFIFSGNICRFDFPTLLIQIASGLGLLGLATLTTDLMMVYCMPLKKGYYAYKYRNTPSRPDLVKKMTRMLNVKDDFETSITKNTMDGNDLVTPYQRHTAKRSVNSPSHGSLSVEA